MVKWRHKTDVSMDDNFIQDLKDPILDQDALTKKYFDDNQVSISFGTVGQVPIINLTGDDFDYSDGLNINGDFSNYNSLIPDIGVEQTSDKRGYGNDYITDKSLNYVTIGSGANSVKGAIRNNSGTFQIYLNGAWEDVVTNFRFKEDSTGNYELEHKPIGFDSWIEVNSGDSNEMDCSGVLPIIQQYKTSIGICQIPMEIDGGTF